MIEKYVKIDDETPWTELAPGLRRKLIHTDNLMLVVVEFTNGPAEVPDPFHDHPHEQASYIAEGELILFVKGAGEQKTEEGRSVCHSGRNPSYRSEPLALWSESSIVSHHFREEFL